MTGPPAPGSEALRQDMTRMVTAQVGYKVTDALLAVGLAHLLPADDLGRLLWSLSLARGLTPIAGLQAEPLVCRRIAHDPGIARDQASGLLHMRLFTTPPFLLAVLAAAWGRPDLWPGVGLVALAIAAEDTWHALGATFVARGRTDLNVQVGVVAQALLLGGSVGAAALTGDWRAVALAMLARSAAALGLAWRHAERPPLRRVPGLLRGVAPFTAGGAVAALTEQADTVLVGAWVGWDAVAAWSLAVRVAWASLFLPQAIAMVLYPVIAVHDRPVLRDALGLAIAGLVVAGAMVVAAPIVGPWMFGAIAPATVTLIEALAPSLPFAFALQLLRPALQARGWERATLGAQLVTTTLGLGAAAALLPALGAIGVGIARAAAAAAHVLCLLAVLAADRLRAAERARG